MEFFVTYINFIPTIFPFENPNTAVDSVLLDPHISKKFSKDEFTDSYLEECFLDIKEKGKISKNGLLSKESACFFISP